MYNIVKDSTRIWQHFKNILGIYYWSIERKNHLQFLTTHGAEGAVKSYQVKYILQALWWNHSVGLNLYAYSLHFQHNIDVKLFN